VLAGDIMKRIKERLNGSEGKFGERHRGKQQRVKAYKNLGVVSSEIGK
jgi:hypothetical protein